LPVRMIVEQVSGSAWAECPNGVESARNDRSQQILARHENTSRTDIHWRGFDKRLRYLPNGTSPTGNGRFFECKDDRIEWQLVLNRQGRLRVAGKSENKKLSYLCSRR
ncbi:hypothetical protein V2A09_25645, partial [Pseudomonas aeruginosa]